MSKQEYDVSRDSPASIRTGGDYIRGAGHFSHNHNPSNPYDDLSKTIISENLQRSESRGSLPGV